VRAIAILLVLLEHGHATARFPDLGPMRWLASLGLLGVEIFFSLSGFLITLLMLREYSRTGELSLRDFYLRRVLRIVPAYAVFLLAVACLDFSLRTQHPALGTGPYAHPTGGDWIAALTYTMNFRPRLTWDFGHLWSLSIEEQFYLIWPLFMALARPRMRAFMPLMAMATALACRCLLVWIFPAHSAGIHGWTFCRLDSIAAGCLLAILAWEPSSRRWLERWLLRPDTSIITLAILVASNYAAMKSQTWNLTGSFTVNAIGIAALIWWLACRPRSIVGRVLNFRFVAGIGTLSYSLYLWQQLFLKPQDLSGHQWWTMFPQNVVLAIVAAFVSYRLVELPFLRLKDRLGALRHWGIGNESGSLSPGSTELTEDS
jgi:peptidoglycan/LPS O-acetylase OafA/YrhL